METKDWVGLWMDYLKPPLVGYEKGFIQETGALPHEWKLVERQMHQGWVYGLTYPQTFQEYLELVVPDADIGLLVKELAASLTEARIKLSQRNRQIRDLRRSLRK